MLYDDDRILSHIGTATSGRYPKGSGETPQRNRDILSRIDVLKKSGIKSDKDLAKAMNMSINELRSERSNAGNERRTKNQQLARKLYEEHNHNKSEVARLMGTNESNVRNYLKVDINDDSKSTSKLADDIEEAVKKQKYIDVGPGVSDHLNVSDYQLKNAVHLLSKKGYEVKNPYVDQLGTGPGMKTTYSVLVKKGTEMSEILFFI